MAGLQSVLDTEGVLGHLASCWPSRAKYGRGRSLYYKDTAALALWINPDSNLWWKVVDEPEINECLETFWPKEISGKEAQSLFYWDITAVAYEYWVRWNPQRRWLATWPRSFTRPGGGTWMKPLGVPLSNHDYGNLIRGAAEKSDTKRAEHWLNEMVCSGHYPPNAICINIVINACMMAGRVNRAEEWLKRMHKLGAEPDAMSYNAVMAGWARAGRVDRAEMWLMQMRNSATRPDVVSYIVVVNAFVHRKEMVRATYWHAQMRADGLNPGGIVCLLGRDGRSRIAAYALHRLGNREYVDEAAIRARQMRKKPTDKNWITLLTHITPPPPTLSTHTPPSPLRNTRTFHPQCTHYALTMPELFWIKTDSGLLRNQLPPTSACEP